MDITQKINPDILDDITLRFILNTEEFIHLDPEEYYVILEQAYWYALDFLKIKPITLPIFAEQIFTHSGISIDTLTDYLKFKKFKQSVKVFGAMLFSPDFTHVLVIRQTNNNNIAIPKGKRFKNETGVDCAIRETIEEVGYDISDKVVDISATIFEKITFYCVFNVDMKYPFKTNTRNEISKIFWFDLRRFNDIKMRKDYRIFYMAYRAVQGKIQEIRRNLFRFDIDKIGRLIDNLQLKV